MSRTIAALLRVRVTAAYATALFTIATVLLALGPRAQDAVVSHLSTNLHNLAQGRLGTLIASAFVTAEGETYLILPGLVCLLALAELLWRSRRLVQAFVLGHLGATLVVAAGLALAVECGWLPVSTTRASDVGLSYGAVSVLGMLTAAMPMRWRPAWVGGWSTIAMVVVVVSHADFTAVGHAVALVLGMLLSTRLQAHAEWTAHQKVMLAVGVAFGVLMLVGVFFPATPIALPAAAAVALAGWSAGHWWGRRTPSTIG